MTRTVEIAPGDILEPGARDARHLLALSIVRQTAFPVFVGFAVVILLA